MGTIRPPDRCRTAAGRGFSFAPQDSNTPSLGEAGFEDEGRTRSGLSRPTPGGEPLGSVASLSVGSKRLRERLELRQFYGPLYPRNRLDAMGKTLRWVTPGSRLLLTDRAANL